MEPVQIFDVASRQAQWLAVRQAAIAGNIANANVASYTAMDVAPFEAPSFERSMQVAQVRLEATHSGHIGVQRGQSGPAADVPRAVSTGAPVSLEQEVARSGAVRADMELNTAIVAAFHRMQLMVSRG